MGKDDFIMEIFSGTSWEAEIVKSLLQDSEINSFLKNNVMNTYAFNSNQTEGVQVMISASDCGRAREIVDEYYRNMKN
jgi:hypothetical protein